MNNTTNTKIEGGLLIIKFFIVVFLFGFSSSLYAATLSLAPSTGVYTAGQIFTARVVVNTIGKAINAAEGTLTFKPGELSVVRITKGSVFNLWTSEPTFSNSAGTVSFSGGSTPPGYTGSSGTVISVTFRIKGAGSPRVNFINGAVLAADGRGTNVLTTMNGGSYTIVAAEVIPEPETIEYIAPANTPAAPVIISSTHADPNIWHTTKTAELSWELPTDVTAIRTLLDENSGTIPTKVYDIPKTSISLENLEEGVQYFHLQFKNNDGWGRVAHYRFAIDSIKPTAFDVSLREGSDLSNSEQTLQLSVEDETSGVERYMVQIDGGEPYVFVDEEEKEVITLQSLEPGRHSVIIEAFDRAGNALIGTLAFTILAFDKPQFTEYPSELSEEVIPVIKGLTRPNSEVHISISKVGSATQEVIVTSSNTGEFIYIPENRFSLGVYELTAIAIDMHGSQSEMSESVRIAVQQPGYIRVGSFVVSLLSVLIPLIALCVMMVLGVWFLIVKLRKLRKGVTKETHEALAMLHTEFHTLQTLVQSQSDALSASRKTKRLTKAEKVLVDSLKEALDESKKKVEKEIIDVENIIE